MSEENEILRCNLGYFDNFFVEELKELWLCLAREMFETEQLIVPSEANSEKWFKFVHESLACEKGLLFVAKSKEKIVGFLFASVRRDFPLETSKVLGVINDVYVLPAFRGRGIGKKLIVECLNELKELDIDKVSLSVLAENKSAIKLYEEVDFKIHGYTMIKTLK